MTGPAGPGDKGSSLVPGGLVLVDKPAGLTSHDVVGRLRRIAGTRRVGHAGTLDPLATGVLVLGVERATKLLGHLAQARKSYAATVRLGVSTVTDDAEGEPTGGAPADGLDPTTVRAAIGALTGRIEQVPSAVSAIKVGGVRSYSRVRAGQEVHLAARQVTVSRFALLASRPGDCGVLDLDVEVDCSTGTYVRALARDLGAALGVGGHLTALRRTRVGPFGLDRTSTLAELAAARDPVTVPLDAAVAECFPRRDLDAVEAGRVGHGGRLDAAGLLGPYGVFNPAGRALALMIEEGGSARPLVVLAPTP